MPKHPMRAMSRIFLTFCSALLLGGCSLSYRLENSSAGLDLRIAWDPIIFEAAIVAGLLVVFALYPRLLGRFTAEPQPQVSVGRIVCLLLAGFVVANFLWPHWAYRVRVADEGVSERRATSTTLIPWNQMVRVRNFNNREIASPEGLIKSPRLEIVGSYEETIYVEENEVGPEIYATLATEVGQRYYQQDELLEGPPDLERREEVLKERKGRHREIMERAQDLLMTHQPPTMPMTDGAEK